MSTLLTSRSPAADTVNSHFGSLSDLDRLIAADTSISGPRRRDVAAALRTLSKAIGKPIDQVPAHPGYINDRIKGFAPKMIGIQPGTWANVKSFVRFALKHAGLAKVPGRYRDPMTAEWAGLATLLPNPRLRYGLSRLMCYCSVNQIRPGMVNDEVVDGFLLDLLTSGIGTRQRTKHRSACRLWNEAAVTISAWPNTELKVPDNRQHFSLPWTAFPASLKADVDAHCAHLSGHDLLADVDVPVLRPRTLKNRVEDLRILASAAVHQGYDSSELRSLADVVDVDRLRAALRYMQVRLTKKEGSTEASTKFRMYKLAYLACTIARHWVKVDEAHLAKLRAIQDRLKDNKRATMTPKNRDRLHQFDDEANVRALLRLPSNLMSKAQKSPRVTSKLALSVQAAVAIEILLMLPIRLGNLARLAIGHNLIRSRKGVWRVAVAAEDVKNEVEIDATLPPETGRMLDTYIEKYLPKLSIGQPLWLFPGRGDQVAKSTGALRAQISKSVLDNTGIVINPHLFRHFAAKTYLEAHPGAYGVIKLVHGHKSVDTTTKFYCGTETAAAFKHFDNHILNLRNVPPSPLNRR